MNEAEMDGYFFDPAIETWVDSWNMETFATVVRTWSPAAIWCGTIFVPAQPQTPWSQDYFWENCESPCGYQEIEEFSDPSGYGELDCSLCQDGIDNDCEYGYDFSDFKCYDCTSPIVIDTLGNGFDLTSTEDGVDFDIAGVGMPVRVSWTQGDDAWLALDRNGNGTIDSGRELFGTVTFQAPSSERNGFSALAVYDTAGAGGNNDGKINANDAVFSALRLWLDTNRNGISEQAELRTLPSMQVMRLDLDYLTSNRVDEHGNRFRFRAKVRDAQGAQVGRWAWDVFLVPENSRARSALIPKMQSFSVKGPKCNRSWLNAS